ncbi:TonB-dependent receptor, partial [Vibrio owensii]
MKLKSLSAAITFAIASFAAHASDENIVVVGSALDQLVQTEINSETLEQKQASDIKDILNTMPSVTVDG